MLTRLRYGSTSTYLVKGSKGALLIDTDYAGTLGAFFRAIKAAGTDLKDISHVIATHYHPDHIGLVGELQRLGVRLALVDVQKDFAHFSDGIFSRDKKLRYQTIDENAAEIITCAESRDFLLSLGIKGEIIRTPSHSEDSVSLILDSGDVVAGDLEPYSYISAYGGNPSLESDWERIMSFDPKRIMFAHRNEMRLE